MVVVLGRFALLTVLVIANLALVFFVLGAGTAQTFSNEFCWEGPAFGSVAFGCKRRHGSLLLLPVVTLDSVDLDAARDDPVRDAMLTRDLSNHN